MAKSPNVSVDIKSWFEDASAQFRNLDSKDPSSWPQLPRYAMFLAIAAVLVVMLWFLWLSDSKDELIAEQEQELKLRDEYKVKLAKAVNLDALKKQREQVQQYVTQLEKQLPSKAEMDALLSDINQAGLGRSLQFDLFRPGQVTVREYYAELPISVRVTGRYHDIGAFAADISNLSRIVTLNSIAIVPAKDGVLGMDAVAKTFRYLDAQEISAQRKAAPAGVQK
ncbi:type 4a pilus biogenesis protein PilO [Rhodoferax antarcticus]|uniref:Pilus assembly protein PilO n=1 Tax=Rhodoferax antarcticus ANT.BR TaxID=1111071 RepID=A0A1Q8YKT3_9BURK|nr:type 4a pilus biogenesis protein PilO [Rhodoferax antarcticus]APW47486.1 pilus assembly protein PilO [Rhodoferax antarcticus]OLP08622.1 pilus assembly protein PilO [Rhodoferax antarcticus ANT.BR]